MIHRPSQRNIRRQNALTCISHQVVRNAGRPSYILIIGCTPCSAFEGLSLHFSPPNGRSTRYEHQDFVAIACRAQRTVQVRLRAPSGSRLVLTALSRTSLRHVVRNAG